MLHTLIVGLGRSGRKLHLPTLLRARALAASADGDHSAAVPFSAHPILAFDRRLTPPPPAGVTLVRSLAEAAATIDPSRTVVHLCTPPYARASTLNELAGLGFRRILVEKPLATDLFGLDVVLRLRRRWDLDLTVTAHWLASALTERLRSAIRDGDLGALRSMSIVQHKPRFQRSRHRRDHPTAFDVEIPHSLRLALDLAGRAHLLDASWSDLVFGGTRVPAMGGAHLSLVHASGVRTDISSDLTSPVRERRITLEFEEGTLTGHYPCSDADDTAQLRTRSAGHDSRELFTDDALTAFLLRVYDRYATGRAGDGLTGHSDVVRLITAAKTLCASAPPVAVQHAGAASPTEGLPAHV
ncbi:hypothetical protein GCM10022402_43620 [Salinactinospora qingdaonensis]|uniref:Oxidoreductase family, NAD-binding Rossmann fold n=2 Tax=Salinactinospora qingdaonensis TaxID=702744 RepID=A0ABP7GEK1_9ACTN